MLVTLALPRDSWSALALALVAAQDHSVAAVDSDEITRATASSVADYACNELVLRQPTAIMRTQGRRTAVRRWLRCRCAPVLLGRETASSSLVFVALPSPAQLFYDGTRLWADYAQRETARWYAAWCRIAAVQTVGGGWASLRQADKALACAMELFDLAMIVGDGDIASKCRVFVGWAHLWSGHREIAIRLFSLELKDAILRDDLVHQRRCESAIINATTNPTLNGAMGPASKQFTLTDCWTKAFAGVDVVHL